MKHLLLKITYLNLAFGWLLASFSACSSLHSNTSIKPNEQFFLGYNQHRPFRITLKNVSNHAIFIYFAPIDGAAYSRQTLQINEEISTKVSKNTAIVIDNKSDKYASVNLKAKGDLNLGMQYQPQGN